MDFVATRRARVSDDAAEQVRRLVEEWGLQPGDRLPPERELAARLGVGRTSVREGLRVLELIGFVEVLPSRGVFLKEGAAGQLDRLVRSWLSAQRGPLLELVELREALETQVAGLAAERAEPRHWAALDGALTTMRDAENDADPDDFVAADNAFHDAIAGGAGNSLLRRALASVGREVGAYKLTTARLGREARHRALADHVIIAAALHERDVEAARAAMRRHIVVTPRDLGVLERPEPLTAEGGGAADRGARGGEGR